VYDYHRGQGFGERERKQEKKGTLLHCFSQEKEEVRTTNKRTASKTCILKNH
jgi:hypothetical protein